MYAKVIEKYSPYSDWFVLFQYDVLDTFIWDPDLGLEVWQLSTQLYGGQQQWYWEQTASPTQLEVVVTIKGVGLKIGGIPFNISRNIWRLIMRIYIIFSCWVLHRRWNKTRWRCRSRLICYPATKRDLRRVMLTHMWRLSWRSSRTVSSRIWRRSGVPIPEQHEEPITAYVVYLPETDDGEICYPFRVGMGCHPRWSQPPTRVDLFDWIILQRSWSIQLNHECIYILNLMNHL